MSKRTASILLLACFSLLLFWFLHAWNFSFRQDNSIVVYFGRPIDILNYFSSNWRYLLWASIYCFFISSASLILAGVIAILLLTFGLRSNGVLRTVEQIAAVSQTIPVLVIVTVCLLIERQLVRTLEIELSAAWYCLLPVTIALLFPPLVNGIEAINRMPIQLKALFRIWNAPTFWRIQQVYLPSAIPDILTGVRTSATWAVGATLITEGLLNGVVGDTNTLGHALLRPFSSGSPGKTPSVAFVATVLGFAVYMLFDLIQCKIADHLVGKSAVAERDYPLQSKLAKSQ